MKTSDQPGRPLTSAEAHAAIEAERALRSSHPTAPATTGGHETLRVRINGTASLTGGAIVETLDGSFFCDCHLETDASRIVQSLNQHSALVATLDNIASIAEDMATDSEKQREVKRVAILTLAHGALLAPRDAT